MIPGKRVGTAKGKRAGREEYLDAFCCPITHEPLVDPVAASDGHTVGIHL